MRIGVLGTGRIGLMHARNLAQITGVDAKHGSIDVDPNT